MVDPREKDESPPPHPGALRILWPALLGWSPFVLGALFLSRDWFGDGVLAAWSYAWLVACSAAVLGATTVTWRFRESRYAFWILVHFSPALVVAAHLSLPWMARSIGMD